MSSQQHQLLLDQPSNIAIFLAFYSPIILVTLITFLSFVFQNFKGLIYLGFMLAAAIVRYYIYYINGATEDPPTHNTVCSSVKYAKYGNATFSVFVFAFSMTYLFMPMFINGHANYWVFSSLLVYSFLDIFIKYSQQCYKGVSEIILNALFGFTISAAFVMAMYGGSAQKFLFFNEMNTGTDTCSRPANQQMKCKVYKNGEMIGDTTAM